MEQSSLQFGTRGLSGLSETLASSSLYSTVPEVSGLSGDILRSSLVSTSAATSSEQQLGAASAEWERPYSLSTNSSCQSSMSQKPLRRIACIQRSTEMNDNCSPRAAVDSPMPMLKHGDRGCISDGQSNSNTTSACPQLRLPISLHGQSLAAGSDETQVDGRSQPKSEILARHSENGSHPEDPSPVCSMVSSVTYKSTLAETTGSETPVKLTKSAKRRMKKKKKQQDPCMNVPCVPYSSQPVSEAEAHLRDLNTWQPPTLSAQFKLPTQVVELLREDLLDVHVRFQEQGIQNLGSTCFLASAMQFLLGSSQFCWLMAQMGGVHSCLDKSKYPVICALGSLSNALRLQSDRPPMLANRREVVPVYIVNNCH